MINRLRIEARDRRMSAIHEAGHAVVARHLGIRVSSVWIVPNEDDVGPKDQHTWTGRAQCELWSRKRRPSHIRQAMVGVAGAVAELVWENDDWADPTEEGRMSETDWASTGYKPGDVLGKKFWDAVDRTHALLSGELRGELYAQARELIVEARWCLTERFPSCANAPAYNPGQRLLRDWALADRQRHRQRSRSRREDSIVPVRDTSAVTMAPSR